MVSFEISFQYFVNGGNDGGLNMIIQGATGSKKSSLIHCASHALSTSTTTDKNPLILLTPIGVGTFNIHGKQYILPLKIPIKYMKPLAGHALAIFQEKMRHPHYILINDMRFIGPSIFLQIYSHLQEAFRERKYCPFGDRSMILVCDLGQLPLVKGKAFYVGRLVVKFLWKRFNIVANLDKI